MKINETHIWAVLKISIYKIYAMSPILLPDGQHVFLSYTY